MERADLWRRLAERPNAVRFEELDQLLRTSGFLRRHRAGSHYTYSRGRQRIVVPRRRPYLLPVYVRLALKLTRQDIANE
jgi:predicted RNA binding protein YcfA (HicA-like mRNA interferase family)